MTDQLQTILSALGTCAVAVSGGVDSVTLAITAHRLLGRERVEMMHAISPAVPPEATQRVRHYAAKEGWNLRILDAREFADQNYLDNPVNRCFFCKSNLYSAIAAISDRQVLSGANTDDLQEYRPGLDAARNHFVRHPYLEACIDKKHVRRLARELGLDDLAELPASPCLSSRVETLIPIDADTLAAIHAVERLIDLELAPNTVRCRVRREKLVIELDQQCLTGLSPEVRSNLSRSIVALLPAHLSGRTLDFAIYRNGSAFVQQVR